MSGACKWFIVLLLSFSSQVYAGVFESLKTLKAGQARIDSSERIYFYKIKRADSAFAIRELKEFQILANELDDPALECYAISLLGDKYARIGGYNTISSGLFSKAIELAQKSSDKLAEGTASYMAGRYYYNFKKIPQAFENLLKANNIFLELGYSNVPGISHFLYYLGNTYYETGDYQKAEHYFLLSIKEHNDDHFQVIQAYNTMAAMTKEQRQFDKALLFLNAILKITHANRDSTWNGLVTGYIGNLYYDMANYNRAIPYLTKGYLENVKHSEWANANICALHLASIYLQKNDLQKGEDYISRARTCMLHTNTRIDRKNYYGVMLLWHQKTGNLPEALKFSRKLEEIKDSIASQKNLSIYGNIRSRIETEKYLSNIAQLEANAKSAELKRNAALVILFLMLLISLLIYNRQRLKREKDTQIFAQQKAILKSETEKIQLEKLRSDEELENARQLLSNYTDNLRQKTELVENFAKELEKLSGNGVQKSEDERNEHFEKLIHSTILTDKDWDNFRQLFDRVHRGFFFRLKEVLPNLSESDTRLLSLIKLQLTNREMANMLGVSIDAIKKAKQRLRKKMNFPGNEREIEELVITI